MARTVEKGIDTALATDMIKFAWEGAYDVGVLVSSDADFVPVVEFLDSKGIRVVQAGFPPIGSALATACWGSFDLLARREEFRRPPDAIRDLMTRSAQDESVAQPGMLAP